MNKKHPIDSILNSDGKGVLTNELHRLFVASGCEPKCHICYKAIRIGLHLKPFFTKITDPKADKELGFAPRSDPTHGHTTASIDVMICIKCSDGNRKLPEHEADELLEVAHNHGMLPTNIEQTSDHGLVKPFQHNYTSSTRAPRFGGCMIVRKNGQLESIIAENPK